MKAIVLEALNSPFTLKEMPHPVAGPGERVVRLRACAFNHRDVWIRKGQYAGLKFPLIPGSDGAGVTDDGREVVINPSINWGDNETAQSAAYKILGLPDNGTFAEQVIVPEANVYDKPEYLSFEQAAALPLAGLTAYRALFARARLRRGEKVLITGIGGGVALTGLQFALAAGAEVYVTSGDDNKIANAISLGAKGGVNYRNADWNKELKQLCGGIDVALDGAGGAGFAHLVDVAAAGGRIAIYGGTAGKLPELTPQRIFWKQLSILGATMGSPSDFEDMLRFVSAHNIVPVVDSVSPLSEAERLAQLMEKGGQMGKIVMEI